MILFADESVDQPIVEKLRHEGHSVFAVAEMSPSIVDDEVLRLANQQSAILLTADKDFGEMVFRENKIACGIVLLRLGGLSPALKASITCRELADRINDIPGAFVVIEPGNVRIRPLASPSP
jgi:predicted nuclease of predicted toxin-antitoxin system